ncbi:glycosyl transferase family 2 [Diaporthe helianthi]|uniref:Glycosyl transferase family 2 n=1 Tax=Diaporthe helianthi TaxID=158607 RepID=A0A2P5HXC3_DIAHE|nr:glycosyl transferase family 2 [Diaporthe helianthi]
MSYTGVAILSLMCAWGAAEKKVASRYTSKYRPFPIPEDPLFTSKDVSVVALLLSPPNLFEQCLRSWLKNQPREVVLVTTFDYAQAVRSAIESYDLTTADRAMIKVVHLDEGVSGHRFQQAMGFKAASGKIMAVTDDQILWPDGLLKNSKLTDPQVGAAGGPIGVHIPEERRDKNIITGWEVAGAKFLFGGRGGGSAAFVANKWTWCLAGCTWLARTAILQDPDFIHALTSETWSGRPMNTGSDNITTRYLLRKGHVIAERNTLQSFWRFLTDVPQTYHHPYILYGTVVRLLRVPVALIHLVGWFLSLRHHPLIALGFLAFYIHGMLPTYRAFWATYPYMFSLGNLLAAVAVDLSPIPIGLWGILTINTDSWVHGDGDSARKQPGIAKKATGRLDALCQATGNAAGEFLAGTWASTAAHARAASLPSVPNLSGELGSSSGNSIKPDPISDQTDDAPKASSEAAEQAGETGW